MLRLKAIVGFNLS